MAAKKSMCHIRVDDDLKVQATQALAAMGLSMSDAVRLFLRRVVVDQAPTQEGHAADCQRRTANSLDTIDLRPTTRPQSRDTGQLHANLNAAVPNKVYLVRWLGREHGYLTEPASYAIAGIDHGGAAWVMNGC
jgi:addiction module RelB/DinJ family antitoxin